MDIERRLRLINKISLLRQHVDCVEILAERARETHNRRKTLIEKGIIKIKHNVFGRGVWVKGILIGYIPNDCDRRREFTDAIFNTICALTEKE